MKAYGFMWNYCIWESSPHVESLHLTKEGAYKAMRIELIKRYNNWRNDCWLFGKDDHKFGLHEWWGIKEFELKQ